ncbi:MAG TPA: response regulator transcription factor [Candidatus Binatia bacterium]|nr:response regulator transcription factor [Candidatus Binatia bacterium]
MSVTIFIADDHAVVRLGLQALIDAEPDLQLIGQAADGREALVQVQQLRPQVLVLDLVLPGMHGLEVLRRVPRISPETRVIVLSMHANEAYVLDALRGGAVGYVLKGSDTTELVRAIRQVVAGDIYLSPPLSMQAVMDYAERAGGVPADAYDTLTRREREVLRFSAESLTSAQIGARLFISARTVETHRANLMHKLGLRNQADVIRYALRRGILPVDK